MFKKNEISSMNCKLMAVVVFAGIKSLVFRDGDDLVR